MRRISAGVLLLIVAAVLVWGVSNGRSGKAEPDWNYLRLASETMELGMLTSVENGYAVFMQDVPAKQNTQRVHLHRLVDGSRATMDPLVHVTEADEIYVRDVSVGKSGVVALATIALSKTQPTETIVALLLLYDTRGNLLSAQRLLGQGQSILRLKVDDDNTIWAVSRGTKSGDPLSTPLLYKYTHLGASVSVIYTRASVPEISLLSPYVRGVGSLSFGMTQESVYCWVPQMQAMLIMAKNGSGVSRVPLAVPRPADVAPQSHPMVFRMYLTEGGNAIADVLCQVPCDPDLKPSRATFAYDVTQGTWRKLQYDLPSVPVALVGVDGERPIFMSRWKSWTVQDSSYQLFKPW